MGIYLEMDILILFKFEGSASLLRKERTPVFKREEWVMSVSPEDSDFQIYQSIFQSYISGSNTFPIKLLMLT